MVIGPYVSTITLNVNGLNENMTTPNLWDSVKAMLIGRFTAIQAYLKKQEEKKKKNKPNFTPKATRKGRKEEPQS